VFSTAVRLEPILTKIIIKKKQTKKTPAKVKCNNSIHFENLGLLHRVRHDEDNRRFFVTSVENVPKILLTGKGVPVLAM